MLAVGFFFATIVNAAEQAPVNHDCHKTVFGYVEFAP
jgi:hypothetical protein